MNADQVRAINRFELAAVIREFIPGADGAADSETIADAILSSDWLARRNAQAVREVADSIAEYYPSDVFLPVSEAKHRAINELLDANGFSRDALSADMMRRAMVLVRVESERLALEGV